MAHVTWCVFSPMSMKPRPMTTSPLPSAVTAPRRISEPIPTSATSLTRIGTPCRGAPPEGPPLPSRHNDPPDLLDVFRTPQTLHEHRSCAFANIAGADVAIV